MYIIKSIPLLLLLTILTFGCSKKTTTTSSGEISKKMIIAALENHNFDYKFYSSNASMDVESESFNMGFNAKFRIKKGGPIWFVGKKFGFEVARGMVVNDTVKAIVRFNKKYSISHVNDIKTLKGMNDVLSYADSYLVGNIVIPKSKKKVTIGKENSTITIDGKRDYSFSINNTNLTVDEMSVIDGNKLLKIKYLRYIKIDKQNIPDKYEITAYEDGSQKLKLNISLSDIDLMTTKKMPFKIPSNYKKLNL